jgi:hypothetical protein
MGDVAVDVDNNTIKKLSAADGTVLWSASVANDSALAVDPVDLGVYTGYGSHSYGDSGTVYKYTADGTLAWTNSISVSGVCNFYYVSYAAVDTTSVSTGAVWTQSGCYGGVAKTNRDTGVQQWSVLTNDIGRASIDPVDGAIYDITNAGSNYNYDTLYIVSADGTTVNSVMPGLHRPQPSGRDAVSRRKHGFKRLWTHTLSNRQERSRLDELEHGPLSLHYQL